MSLTKMVKATHNSYIEGEYNKADLGTKTTLNTKRRYELVSSIFDNDCQVIERKKYD